MVYRGVCARLNGQPDSAGDILGSNFTIPNNPVRVTHEFYKKTIVGTAWVKVEENEVVGYVNFFDKELFQAQMVESLYLVVGGSILSRKGETIDNWMLTELAVTSSPCDKTLTKLIWNRRNNCCEYKGPPFRTCRYCGSRESF